MAGKGKPGPKKGQGGRPKKMLTNEQIRQAEEMAGLGMDHASIALVLGICETTLFARKKDQEELSEALKRGLAKGLQE